MKNYKVTWFSAFHGKHFEKVVEASSIEEATKKCGRGAMKGMNLCVNEVDHEYEQIEDIQDAEEILRDMSLSGVDKIVVKDGFGASKTYTKLQVKKSLGLI